MTDTLTEAARASDWRDELDGYVTVVDVIEVTHDVRTFVLAPDDARPVRFSPGQYLTLTIPVAGELHERCYTIASSPTRPSTLEITVKRSRDGGPVSTWLHDHVAVGDRLHVRGPYGCFTIDEHPADRYLFVSAGSGITPLMSMTRALRDLSAPVDAVFVHHARTPDDVIFAAELDAIAATRSGVAVSIACGRRPSLAGLLAAAPDLADREVFVCGPAGFMTLVRELLTAAGADPARCHQESFVLGAESTARPPATGAPKAHQIELRRSGRTVSCPSGTTVLQAARDAGIVLPSSCEEGMCGTCRSVLLSGKVDMDQAGGIRPRDVAAGAFLPCCSTPLGDLIVDA